MTDVRRPGQRLPGRLGAILGLLALLLAGGCLPFRSSEESKESAWSDPLGGVSFQVGDSIRTYQLHVPASYDRKTPMPLVLVFHGIERDAIHWQHDSGWSAKADEAGFVVVFPETYRPPLARVVNNQGAPAAAQPGLAAPPGRSGRPGVSAPAPARSAQPGAPPPAGSAQPRALTPSPAPLADGQRVWQTIPPAGARKKSAGEDDLTFIAALLDDIQQRYPIDPRRIYVTGFSEGAAMTYRIGAELGNRVAAIAPVEGLLLQPELKLAGSVSLLALAGQDDQLYPVNGGEVQLGSSGQSVTRPALSTVVDRWARSLECPTGATTIYDQDGVLGRAYRPCKADSEVLWYVVSGLGHLWPDGPLTETQHRHPVTYPIRVTDLIWEFFARHQLASG